MSLDREQAHAYLAEEVQAEAFDIDRQAMTIGDVTLHIPPRKPEGAPAPGGEMIAGLGKLGGILAHRTGRMLEKQRQNIAEPPSVAPEEGKKILDALSDDVPAEAITPERNINIKRHHEGAPAARLEWEPTEMLRIAESSDDIAKVLEYTATRMETLEKVSFESIREGTQTHAQIMKEFEPILRGQKGLWNARQLFAARRILATVGDELSDLGGRLSAGDTSPETILRFQQKSAAFMAIHGGLRQNVRGVAQALAQQRMIAETLDSGNISRIAEVMSVEGGATHDIKKRAALFMKAIEEGDPNNINTVVDGLQRSYWKRGLDLAVEYWQASILSGPTTHIVNLTGNAAVNLWEAAAVRPLAASIGTFRTLIPGAKPDRVTGEEAIANVIAGWAGTRDGISAAYEILKGKQGQFRGSRVDYRTPDQPGELEKAGRWVGEKLTRGSDVGGTAGEYAAALPFKMLQAGDEIFKTLAYRQEMTALVVRDAMSKGLKGEAFNAHVNAMLADPPAELYDQAMRRAREMTFQERNLGGLSGALLNGARTMVEEYPALKFLMPFLTTPMNLVRYATETSILATMSPKLWGQIKRGGAEADIAMAKMTLGTLVTVGAFHAHAHDLITGNGPEDYRLRELMMKTGWRPNAVRIGDQYFTYNRTDPFAASISAMADFLDKAKYAGREAETSEAILQVISGIAEHTVDQTYMRGVSDLMKALDGSRKQQESFLANYAAGFVPYSSALRTIQRHDDDYQRVTYSDQYTGGLLHHIKQKVRKITPDFVPLVSGASELPKKRYWDGTFVIPQPGAAAWNSSPIKWSEQQDPNAADEALIRNGYGPGPPPSTMSIGGVEFSLLALDRGRGHIYDAFVEKVGQRRKEVIDALIETSLFQEMEAGPGSDQAYELRHAIGQATRAARAEFIEADLGRLILADGDASSQVAIMFGMNPQDAIEMMKARMEAGIEPSEEEKQIFRVKRQATKPGLPVPRTRGGTPSLRF